MKSLRKSWGKICLSTAVILVSGLAGSLVGCTVITRNEHPARAENPKAADPLAESPKAAPPVETKASPYEVTLEDDRKTVEELRQNIPKEKREENDQLKEILTLMGETKANPSTIRDRFNRVTQRLRQTHQREAQRQRDELNRTERKERDKFYEKQKKARDAFAKKKASREERKEFFDEQDQARRDFTADQRDRRDRFNADMKLAADDFNTSMRDKNQEFNQELRAYTQRYNDMIKAKKNPSAMSQPAESLKTGHTGP